MARMIPSLIPEKSPASERIIFERLKLDPQTIDWVVLHSVGLSRTERGPYGEIDFVILVPGLGIVCLEVKGGLVQCNNGIWTTYNRKEARQERLKTSPYMQAREGMFALRKAIGDHFGRLHPATACPFSYAVVFPSVTAPPQTPGEEPWETIDSVSLSRPISDAILANIRQTRKKLRTPPTVESTSPATMAAIRQYLRPDFERIIVRSSTIRQSEEQLIRLTEAQYDYLDIAEVNERAVIEGAAGTGKTALAIEFAKRQAASGRKTLLICYNKVLASWIGRQVAGPEAQLITAGSYNAIVRQAIRKSSYCDEYLAEEKRASTDHLFNELVPFYGELALNEIGPLANTLIIDEAQDLIKESCMTILNLLLVGGIAGGRWAIFGDFTRQAIYSSRHEVPDLKKLLHLYCSGFSTVPLKVNCRNTKPIGEETALLSGFESLPYRVEANGLPVDCRYWRTRSDEQQLLTSVIGMLLAEGLSPDDIVVLAPNVFANTVASKVSGINGSRVIDISDAQDKPGSSIIFSTIHAFKGMESTAVVLIGIENIETEEEKSLLYVGMSRARSHLVLCAHERIKKLLPELTRKRLAGGWL